MVSCWRRCTVCNFRLLHDNSQLRFSNSKHFRFYWTKKRFISEWYFTKNHEIGSRVVRKVKKSWDLRRNRELALRPAWESKSNIADVFVIFIAWTSQKASKVHTVSKLAIVLIWNIQSPHEDNRPVPPVKCTKSAHRGTATNTRDSCRSDIGRFRAEPTDLRKVSTSEWHICISQCPQ